MAGQDINNQSELGAIPSVEFSVIITCHYEEKSIEEFSGRLSRTMESLGRTYEIIFVNDGSTDKTFEKLKMIFQKDSHVKTILDLFRNSGQLAAMTAGIQYAKGKNFIFMDSDLQLDPEEIPQLVAEFDKGFDIVSGYRKKRRDPLLRIISSRLANFVAKNISGHKVSDLGCTFKIYNGNIIRAFEFGPFKKFQPVYVYSKAQTYSEIPVTHRPRKYGRSGWTFKTLFAFHIDNIMGMSRRPFQVLSLFCLCCAFLFLARIFAAWFVSFSILPEVTPGLILNVILAHLLLTLSVMSVVGEYVIRNFMSLQKCPDYIIREILQKCSNKGT
jgi:undecaprenyl-phosphate 4-deoxy-4-formamido-L-arabinose transferase